MQRIHATNLKTNNQVFGSLNIGELQETNLKTISNQPIYKNKDGELFFCSKNMKNRINQRIEVLKNDNHNNSNNN